MLLFEKIGTEEYLICYLLFKEYLISYLFFIEEYLICYLLFKEYLISYLFFILLLALQISYHIVSSGARVANIMEIQGMIMRRRGREDYMNDICRGGEAATPIYQFI